MVMPRINLLGVMPQTLESIRLAKKDHVPMIVALNKMDKGVQKRIDAVKRDLMNAGVDLEDMGGNVQIIPISAKTKMGLDTLKEAILVQSEIMELEGDSHGPVEADVIEAKKTAGFGPLATILIKKGSLKRGDVLVVGETWGRVRSMKNEFGANLNEAGLSCPVEISGLKGVPKAGDPVVQVDSEVSSKRNDYIGHCKEVNSRDAFGRKRFRTH
jgi:translation initiation factor IF-2